MKLYYSPGACSLAPHMVLEAMGTRYGAVKVDLAKKTFEGGDFLKVNPKGSVPALELDSGEVLTENQVILQYLADQKPDAGLFPKAGSLERYRGMEMLNFIATELHKGFAALWNPAAGEDEKRGAKERLAKKFDYLSGYLKGKKYLLGPKFSVADAYLATVLSWAQYHKLDMSKWPELMGYFERMQSEKPVQAALKAEGLVK